MMYRSKLLGLIGASFSILIAIFGLLSYIIPEMDLFGRVSYKYIPMAPSTAVAFVILGIVLVILHTQSISNIKKLIMLFASLAVSLFGILEVFEYFVGIDLNYENSIIPSLGLLNGVPIARMSPATGAVFFISATSIFFLILKSKSYITKFGYLTLIISFTFCLSYLYGTPLLYEDAHTIPMALTTAISFMFLSISIIFLETDNFHIHLLTDTSTKGYLLKFLLPLSTLSVIFGGIAVVFSIHSSSINPAFVSAVVTILIVIVAGLLSSSISNHIGRELDKAHEATKQAKELLHKKSKALETIIKEAPNPIILHTDDGKISMINQAWIDSSGYTLDEIPTTDEWVNRTNNDSLSRASIKEHIYSLYSITKKVDESEFEIISKSGEKLIWNFCSAPLGIVDNKRTVITSAMDVTELKQKDKLIMTQSRHAAMGEMIGMIAHQWRQPISIIAMAANNILLDIALDNFKAQDAEKFSNSILKQTAHLSKTIDDFRNFFKPDKEISKVKLQEIIEETIKIVNNSLINNSIVLRTYFESNSEVNAYPRELMQVFVNIINNSKDAMVSNNIEKPVIEIRVYEDAKYVNTEILDNGKGIDGSILPKIFDPYFTTKDEKTGTGLGLYMSKMIIQDHLNGIIETFNTDNGACFKISLLK